MDPTPGGGTTGTFGTVVDRLTPVPAAERARFLGLPPDPALHAPAHRGVAALREVETGGAAPVGEAALPVRVAAWNLERCLHPGLAAAALKRAGAALALLTEMDCGMARTGQAHTAAEIAQRLGQRYAYGLEFLELTTLPAPPPGLDGGDAGNALGFHGNALVSALAIEAPAVIRLDEAADWFAAPWQGLKRIGNRMAVAARVGTGGFRFVACAAHLENRTDGLGRAAQMRTLLDALDSLAGGLPVLIGGDLNTRVAPGRFEDPAEPLFALAARRGYAVAGCNAAGPTTRSSFWNRRDSFPQLDWFLARGLAASRPEIVPALAPDGTVLSDHELIALSVGPAR